MFGIKLKICAVHIKIVVEYYTSLKVGKESELPQEFENKKLKIKIQ
jgi:hypothetical protein